MSLEEKFTIKAAEPEPEEEEEEEEEEDLVDPQIELTETCTGTTSCSALKNVLDTCNDRVNGKSNTSETCYEELIDLLHCVDHCVEKSLFNKLV